MSLIKIKLKKITKNEPTRVLNQEPLNLKSLDEPLGYYAIYAKVIMDAGTVVTRKVRIRTKHRADFGGK